MVINFVLITNNFTVVFAYEFYLEEKMNYKKMLPLIILILIKFSWFYNVIDVSNNYMFIVLISSALYFTLISLTSKNKFASIVIAVIITTLLKSEMLYYRFFNRMLSFTNISQARFLQSVVDGIFIFKNTFDFVLYIDVLVLIFILFVVKDHFFDKLVLKVTSLAMALYFITFASFANDVTTSIKNQEFFTYHISEFVDIYFLEDEQQQFELKETQKNDEEKTYTGIFEGKNIINIQIESFQDMVLLKEYNGQEITPFLNKLISDDSFYFSSYYQQLGIGNTSDAEFSSHNSIYPSMIGVSYDRYRDHDFRGLPVLLKERGYSTYAFHGNTPTYWFRDAAYKNQGIDNFYSINEFESDEIIGMGLSDRSFFRQSVEVLKDVEGLFYGFFLTLTNHHPYELPEDQVTIELMPEDEDTIFGGYIESIRYTDERIEEFYNDLKDEGLLDNTVFVLYGDHHGLISMDKDNKKRISEFLGYEYDFDQMMNVPLIIHSPGSGISEVSDNTSDQLDFLPTMTNLMGIDSSELFMMGQDLLNTEDFFTAFQTFMTDGSFIKDDIVFKISRDGIYDHSRAWNKSTGEAVPLEECRKYYERALYELDLSRYIVENNKVIRGKH